MQINEDFDFINDVNNFYSEGYDLQQATKSTAVSKIITIPLSITAGTSLRTICLAAELPIGISVRIGIVGGMIFSQTLEPLENANKGKSMVV